MEPSANEGLEWIRGGQAFVIMNEKVISADQSTRLAARGQASAAEYARKARAAAARIVELTDRYNTGLIAVSNKWNQMSAAPGPWGNQRHQFEMPAKHAWTSIACPPSRSLPDAARAWR